MNTVTIFLYSKLQLPFGQKNNRSSLNYTDFVEEAITTLLSNDCITELKKLVGSSKAHLQNIAIDIFQICLNYNIKLIPQWIPREKNELADDLSKVNDSDNWGIDFNCFKMLSRKYGPFTIDRFADERNKKLHKFNSKFFCPGSSAVDAFTENWVNENNWICPPINLIGSVIKHMKLCKCKGTLLIPIWTSAYFWPLIYPDGRTIANFVKDFTVINPYFISYSCNSMFSGFMKFKCIALFISFE